MNPIRRCYARQRLASYHRFEQRQREGVIRGAGWALFFLVTVGALLLSGLLG